MGAEENIAAAKRGYAAFIAGDVAAAMAEISDDVEWTTAGNSAISGTASGKEELGENWAQLAAKGWTTSPEAWFGDDHLVVVLTHAGAGGETVEAADVLTFDDDAKLIAFRSLADPSLLERVFGTS
jgi:ketosteroid isomerase-like protein